MDDKRLHLGRVERVEFKGNTRLGIVRSLYQGFETQHFLRWQPTPSPSSPGTSQRTDSALWVNAPADLRVGSVWQFRMEKLNGMMPDWLRVADPTPPIELIDHKSHSIDVSRSALNAGLLFDAPPSEITLLWVASNRWVGPLRLVAGGKDGVWVAHSSSLLRPLSVYTAVAELVDQVDIDGPRLILAPGQRLPTPVGEVDWANDAAVLRRFIKWAASEHAAHDEAASIALRFLDRLVEGMQADEGASDSMLAKDRIERARSIVRDFQIGANEAAEVLEDVIDHPRIRSGIERAEGEARRRATETVRSQLQSEVDGVRAKLEEEKTTAVARIDDLRAEAEALRQQVSELRDELELRELYAKEQKAEAERQAQEFESALAGRIQEAMAQPLATLAELPLYRVLLSNAGLPEPSGGHPVQSALGPRIWTAGPEAAVSLDTFDDFKAQVRSHFKAQGLSSGVGQVIAASLLSGAMPLVAGGDAYRALRSFADAAFGGRHLWIPASPTLVEPGDLLGHWDSPSGTFVPHPSGLLDLLEWASEADTPYLVVIDGTNLGPVDSYLRPLLDCYIDAQAEAEPRSLPFNHRTRDGSHRHVVSWPRHVHIAGVLSDGAYSIRMSPSIWESAAYLHLDDFDRENSATRDDSVAPTRASVSPETWLGWAYETRTSLSEFETSTAEALGEPLSIPACLLRSAARTYAAHRLWSTNDAAALRTVVYHRLLPYFVAAGQADEFSAMIGRSDMDPDELADKLGRAARLLG